MKRLYRHWHIFIYVCILFPSGQAYQNRKIYLRLHESAVPCFTQMQVWPRAHTPQQKTKTSLLHLKEFTNLYTKKTTAVAGD